MQMVDADIREDCVELKYMDSHGTERRVGAKTRYADVKAARVLRVSRRVLSSSGNNEKAGLMGRPPPTRRKKRDGRKSTDVALATVPESPTLPAAAEIDLEEQRSTEPEQAEGALEGATSAVTTAPLAASAEQEAHANDS